MRIEKEIKNQKLCFIRSNYNNYIKMNALLSGLATYLEGIDEEINFGKIHRYPRL